MSFRVAATGAACPFLPQGPIFGLPVTEPLVKGKYALPVVTVTVVIIVVIIIIIYFLLLFFYIFPFFYFCCCY